jgi:hypothetical protein
MPITLADSFASIEAQSAIWDEEEGPSTIRLTTGGPDLACAVVLDPISRTQKDDGSGWMTIQRVRVDLRKALVPTAPDLRSVVRVGAHDYQVMEVGGHNEHALTWVLQCMRILPSS